MDHHGRLRRAVRVHVGAVESPRQLKVELDRAHLPLALKRILHKDVDLRAVKSPISLLDLVAIPSDALVEDGPERVLGTVPGLDVADEVVRARPEPEPIA